MTFLLFIIGFIASGFAIAGGAWGAVIPIWIGIGLALFVWQTVCDAGKAVTNALGHDQYNFTQNRIEITEDRLKPPNGDPTKPDASEDLQAIIEVYRRTR